MKLGVRKIVYLLIGLGGLHALLTLLGISLFAPPALLLQIEGWLLAIGGLNWGLVALLGKDLLDLIGLD